MDHNSKLPEPVLFALSFSGSFDIPEQTFDLINDDDEFMFVVMGHLVAERKTVRANGDVHWAGRMHVDDAVRVADPALRVELFEKLGLAGYQGELEADSGQQLSLDEQPPLDMGEPAMPLELPAATPVAAAPRDEETFRPDVPASISVPTPPGLPVKDKALHAFLYGGE